MTKQHGLRASVIITVILLAGCVTNNDTYTRLDGQPIVANSPSGNQFYIDQAACRASSLTAGNSVAMPAQQQQTTQTQSQQTNIYLEPESNLGVPTPNYHPTDWSWIGDDGAIIAANSRRQELETATMQSCMAQRGYAMQNK